MLTRWKSLPTFAQVGIIAVIALAIRSLLISSGAVERAPTAAASPNATTARPARLFSMQDYNYLVMGMLQSEAEEVLGGPGEELSSNKIGDTYTVMYQWKVGPLANVNATFQNGKLVSKAQFGLR